LAEQQSWANTHELQRIHHPLPGNAAREAPVGNEHKVEGGLGPGKGPEGDGAIGMQAQLDANGKGRGEGKGAGAGEAAVDGVVEGDDGVPGALEGNIGLADGALEGAVGALAVDDPGDHAVLVRLEGAGARVDPVGGVVSRVLVGEADEAAAGRVGLSRRLDGLEGGRGE
jgi:hypothetical protein